MLFEDKLFLQQTADMALKKMNINAAAVFHYLSENATFIIYDGDRPLYTLRISRPSYHSLEELQGELDWLSGITAVSVKKPVSGIVECNDCYCVLFDYIDGNPEPEDYTTEAMFYTLGRLTALLHTQNKLKISRPNWDYNNMVGAKALWGDWRVNKQLTEPQYDMIDKALRLCNRLIGEYRTDKYGLIHTDIRSSNIIRTTNGLVIADFDDCGYGYYMQELAGSLSFCENADNLEQLKSAWFKGYECVTPLTAEDKHIADSFILLRKIQLLAWITSHYRSDYVMSLPVGFERESFELARRFRDRYE